MSGARRSTAAAAAAFVLAALAAGCSDDGGAPDDLRPLPDSDPDALAAAAEGYLATERPWRAARVMRRYLDEVDEPPAERRLLAARAEAGWGAWDAVARRLDGLEGLDVLEDGIGLHLLGRARDEAGDADGAAEAYRAFLALSPPAGELESERAAARLRLALALVRAGEEEAGREALASAAAPLPGDSPWPDLLHGDALAARGDTAAVRRTVARFGDGTPGLRAWRARVEAARRTGDAAAARALANRARRWAGTDATRAEFFVAAGRAALEMGDVAAARDAFRAAIDRDPAGRHAREAADLLRGGDMSPEDHLAVARVLREQGLHEESLDGYRRWLEAGSGTAAERAGVHLEHANALFYAERYDEVEAALRPIASALDARFLLARAAAHGDEEERAARLYVALAEDLAGSSRGGLALLLAAGTLHDIEDLDGARELYRRVVRGYPGSDVMGLATMRLAGIEFLEGDPAEAARLWDGYRARYPAGSRALQATYWSGRAREAAGDSAGAAELYRAVRRAERDSYYALLASERLREPFWPLPLAPSPGEDAAASRRVAGWMEGVDLLRAAGFPEEAAAEADRVAGAAGRDRATLYALAEALAARGYSRRAILIGLRLQGSGAPNPRLLRILYPFPYRTLVTEEARDRGFDPFVAAALIRQESLFEARATSHVGARGLMQIMPATGRALAEQAGIEPWDPETLYHPEINVHLGTLLLASHIDAYDGSLPSVFSAYNAGEHRVEWWSEYPEYGHDELFTERIPFRETRDYVKTLVRNRALYEGLWGEG